MNREPARHIDLWDPLSIFPNVPGWLLWCSCFVPLAALHGPLLLRQTLIPTFTTANGALFVPDYFQDYASARNVLKGMPAYTGHDVTAPLYLGFGFADSHSAYSFQVNAHPPSSILLSLPLASLDFREAFAAWNALSTLLLAAALIILIRNLNIRIRAWHAVVASTLLLLSPAFWAEQSLGQFSRVLLFLLASAWAAHRADRPVLAGFLLGAVSAIKLFPVMILVVFALSGKWKVAIAGAASVFGITAVTAMIIGFQPITAYMTNVYPRYAWFENAWHNVSLGGFWSRLFDSAPYVPRTYYLSKPLLYFPWASTTLWGLSSLLLIILCSRAFRRESDSSSKDLAFSLSIVAMLLISPIAWIHYWLLLALPGFVLWKEASSRPSMRPLLITLSIASLSYSPSRVAAWALDDYQTASYVHSLFLFPLGAYLLLFLFAWLWALIHRVAEPAI